MIAPELPGDENERIAALRSYNVLDTKPEATFDAITRLVALLVEVDTALVSLVDVDRQWFKSRYGLSVSETPRDISFCGHVVAESAPLIVRDALDDPRFCDNPLVVDGPRIRFYAGMPLQTADGFVLGTLCAIDGRPKELAPRQLEALAILADQVVELLEVQRERHRIAIERASALEAERRLRALFDAMAEGVVVQDSQAAILEANPAAERILGLTLDEMTGRTSLDPRWRAVHEDGSPFPGDTHPAVVTLRTGQPLSNVVMGVHKRDGSLAWISINARPLQDGDAKPHGAVTTFHDITAMRGSHFTHR